MKQQRFFALLHFARKLQHRGIDVLTQRIELEVFRLAYTEGHLDGYLDACKLVHEKKAEIGLVK